MTGTFEMLPFYRGMSARYPTDRVSVVSPRRSRRPRNSSTFFHETADQWFAQRFGIPYRSQSIFVTSATRSACAYAKTPAHVMRIIPLSTYQYCWSPKISDLLFVAARTGQSRAEIEKYLDSAEYCETALEEAYQMGHEVMLYCDRYVAIPESLLDARVAAAAPSIILPP